MNPKLLLPLLCLPLLSSLQAADVDQAQLAQEAIGIVKRFGGALKPELVKAIQAGGPAHAISVCAEKAPAIARDLSLETGWSVKRVSLKPRNAESATPDAWESSVLEQFDRRQASGESAAKMTHAEVVDGRFRFMKAQGVEPVCMNCHAADIEPAVETAISRQYPADEARGYTLGQVRGAFSLSRDL
jgi:hypothetical protein